MKRNHKIVWFILIILWMVFHEKPESSQGYLKIVTLAGILE